MSDSDIEIRAITRDEVPQWWELRLRALKDHPEAFGSDYETSRQRGYGFVVDRNFGPDAGNNVILAAFDPDGTILSTAGVFRETGKRSHIAMIIGVYTRPESRGRGLSRRLIDAAIAHCRAASGVLQVHIAVNADNAPARHVYESAGFVPWGVEPRAIALPDRYDDEIHLAMMLDDGSRAR